MNYIEVIIIGMGLFFVGFLIYGSLASHKWRQENRGRTISEENDHFYRFLFYFNKNDPRVFVPKRTGGGYTINFANPVSVFTGVLVIVLLLALNYFRNY